MDEVRHAQKRNGHAIVDSDDQPSAVMVEITGTETAIQEAKQHYESQWDKIKVVFSYFNQQDSTIIPIGHENQIKIYNLNHFTKKRHF